MEFGFIVILNYMMDLPWYILGIIALKEKAYVSIRKIIAVCCGVAIFRAVFGYLIFNYFPSLESADAILLASVVFMLGAILKRFYDYPLIKIIYTILLLFSLASFGNMTAHGIFTIVWPSATHALLSPYYFLIKVVIWALVIPLLYRFCVNPFREALNDLPDRSFRQLCVMPVIFFMFLLVYYIFALPVGAVTTIGFVATRLFIMPIGLVSYYINLRTMLDVQKRIQTEKELAVKSAENSALEQIHHMRDKLMESISHEARAPLAVLSSYIWLVATELKQKGIEEKTVDKLTAIISETERVANLIDHIKNITMENLTGKSEKTYESKLLSGASVRCAVDMGGVVRQMASMYRHLIESRGIIFELDIENDLPPIIGRAEELKQVIFNIIQNAYQHTREGAIGITVKHENNHIVTTITDTGTGIESDLIPHVFQRGVSGKEGGTGIGLSLTKIFVEAHGGTVDIVSTSKNGTTVTIALPVSGERINENE